MCGGGDQEIKETRDQIEAARIAKEQWDRYQSALKPFENKWIERVERDRSGEEATATGMANVLTGEQFDEATQATNQRNFSQGIDPSSGRFQGDVNKLSLTRSGATGEAMAETSQGVENRRLEQMGNLIAVGRGEAAEATSGLGDVAAVSGQKAIRRKLNRLETRDSYGRSIGSAIGSAVAFGEDRSGESKKPSETADPYKYDGGFVKPGAYMTRKK